jgi:hypothetical protein
MAGEGTGLFRLLFFSQEVCSRYPLSCTEQLRITSRLIVRR